jgi:hypothetical protein
MTFMQAFKVWWSYSWRASILVIPLTVIMTAWSLAGIIPVLEDTIQSGKSVTDLNVDQLMGLATGGMSMMLLSLLLITGAQILAMRWALNSRWSNFRLKAVPPDAEAGGAPGAGDSVRARLRD